MSHSPRHLTTALLAATCFAVPSPLSAQPVYQPGDVLVSSRTTNSVKWYDSTGAYIGDFVAAGDGGLSAPQELLVHPSGDLLVTGRWNTALLRYDQSSGTYVEPFTTGYDLDQPTKTHYGPDSLIHVAQWGTQNKIARFDPHTGAFVDEFTEVGVYQGMGMAWDGPGKLYVASWNGGADGFVQVFGPDGTDLGFLIEGDELDGPTNIWFGDDAYLWLSDWSRGEVYRIDATSGALVDTPVTGLTTVEGFAWDRRGRLYLGDWTANRIHRYDYDTETLSLFTAAGGMMQPNGLLIVPDPEPGPPPAGLDGAAAEPLVVFPNPASGGTAAVRLPAGRYDIEVVDASGRPVLRVEGAEGVEGLTGLAGGFYVVLARGEALELRGRLAVTN